MEQQDFDKDFHLKLSAEFERIDKFLEKFQQEFVRRQLLVISQQEIVHLPNDTLAEQLQEYASRMFSCADSIADKDENYSDARLALELEAMTQAIDRYPKHLKHSELGKQTHMQAKELLIQFFPELIKLSANGFRLLEKYCLLYNYEFVSIDFTTEMP
ncbi:hypothetical protein [uncultured Draconibacterium sp.]|uniref:hypothetical protein n=1 Tax=uncultured Draconibacterium sp. TaxID=1573823 RepID=UPI0025EA0C8D|nr:hypothetical protein [uncultured Draconibacterium sp.]